MVIRALLADAGMAVVLAVMEAEGRVRGVLVLAEGADLAQADQVVKGLVEVEGLALAVLVVMAPAEAEAWAQASKVVTVGAAPEMERGGMDNKVALVGEGLAEKGMVDNGVAEVAAMAQVEKVMVEAVVWDQGTLAAGAMEVTDSREAQMAEGAAAADTTAWVAAVGLDAEEMGQAVLVVEVKARVAED